MEVNIVSDRDIQNKKFHCEANESFIHSARGATEPVRHMQETEFIQQNKDKWREFEGVLKSTDKDPERLTDLFIETTDDLSFSRTYYPNRSVRVYLNSISQQVYQAIYKNKSNEKNFIRRFWMEDLPDAMWYSRKSLLLSFLLFAIGVIVGVVSSIYYPDFARIILGDQYISMTEANIAKGDPMAVYKDSGALEMFMRIAWNNIQIAFGTFVLGALFGIGTIYVILSNAVMVGTFVYFFIERGLFKESFLAIMLHGTLELSMIVVAGCAGFALARGILFPGTYSRGLALIHSARNGIKILCGVTVLLLYAAFIESFATRHTDMPDVVRGGLILLSAGVVWGYFVWYPAVRHKRGLIKPTLHDENIPSHVLDYALSKIKTSGTIFTESFVLFTKNIRTISLLGFSIALILTVIYGIITSGAFHQLFNTPAYLNELSYIYPWIEYHGILDFEKYPLVFAILAISFTIYSNILIRKFDEEVTHQKQNPRIIENFVNTIFISGFTALPFLLPSALTAITFIFSLPFSVMWMYIAQKENKFFITALPQTFQLVGGNFIRITGIFLSTFIIQYICMFIFSSSLIWIVSEFITMNFPYNADFSEEITYAIYTFFLFLVPGITISLTLTGTVLGYYTLKEITEATHLKESIAQVGNKKRAYGLEKES